MKIKPYHCNFSNIYHYTKIGLEKQQNRVYVWYTHSTLKELMSLLRSFVEDMFELQKHKTKLEYVKQINSNEILNTNNLSYIYKQCPR